MPFATTLLVHTTVLTIADSMVTEELIQVKGQNGKLCHKLNGIKNVGLIFFFSESRFRQYMRQKLVEDAESQGPICVAVIFENDNGETKLAC